MRRRFTVVLIALLAAAPASAGPIVPDAVPDLAVLGQQAHRGNDLLTTDIEPVAPTSKTVDGNIGDWTGDISRYGGTAIYSHGEFVYQDYLMDAWGADDGQDAQRVQYTDALSETESRTYRAEALMQAAGEQFGADCTETVCAVAHYGNVDAASIRGETDIEEVRIAADEQNVYLLVRTAGMTAPDKTGIVVVAMTGVVSNPAHEGPAGVRTRYSSLLAVNDRIVETSMLDAPASAFSVATNAAGYTNATEIAIPRSVLNGALQLSVATCAFDAAANDCKTVRKGDAKSDLLNVAFRFDEPARIWMDHDQAFALRDGDIDRYMVSLDIDDLLGGRTQTFTPRPGYWERVYVSDSPVNFEGEGNNYHQGAFQHYGVYLPTTFRSAQGTRFPATWWAHYRGGHAHDAAAWVPGLLRQFGEAKGNIMVFPSARGTSSWYVGRGHEDFLEVWDDSMATLPIDPDRVTMTGYSMGGFASWFLPMVYPDRFAAASPQEGPPTQGLFLGIGPNEFDPREPQQGADVQAELMYNIIENARNVPYVTYHGTDDELVPISGIAVMHAKFSQLGYRHRLYALDGNEHYTTAVLDRWEEAATYVNRFRRDPDPPRVTYRTWPALEHAASTISANHPNLHLGYRFNKAYWVSDLNVRTVRTANGKPDPRDWGTIDATTFGHGMDQVVTIPELGAGEQGTPFEMIGQAWLKNGWTEPRNAFTATLTNLSTATLDIVRMGLGSRTDAISGQITTDGPTTVTLRGGPGWEPSVFVNEDAGVSTQPGTITLTLPAAETYEIILNAG